MILLKKGLIYDGTGDLPYQGDVLIQDDKIMEVASEISEEKATQIINVDGFAVTPGFIDIHRHCDKCPFQKDEMNVYDYGAVLLRQGITTVVTGNCGISMYPLHPDKEIQDQMQEYYEPVLGDLKEFRYITSYKQYISHLEKCNLPVNTSAMIGMGAVRIAVKGFSSEKLNESEKARCRNILEEALKEGSPGASTGLMYLPECYASTEEMIDILRPLGTYKRLLTVHMRGEGDNLVKSVAEAIEIAEAVGCPLEISHFKSCGCQNWKKEIHHAITLMNEARQRGQNVMCDFYPYDCGSTTLLSMIPPQFVNGNIVKMLESLKSSEGKDLLRAMLKETYAEWDNYALSLGWDRVIISSVSNSENSRMKGKNISEIVKEFGYEDEVDAVADILIKENGTAAIVIQSMDQNDIDTVAGLPYSCVISDAIYAETDCPHPRMYGAFPKFL